MPYIKQAQRERLDVALDVVDPLDPGELNYCMSILAKRFFRNAGHNYGAGNAVMGVFDSAKHEFYRRVMAPYEDMKAKDNGDIYSS